MIRRLGIGPLLLAAAALSGCGGTAPADVGAGDPDRPLYETRCAVCHGLDGSSRGPAAPSGDLGDPDWRDDKPAAAIQAVILEGRGEMPSFRGEITDEELERIVGYVRRLPELKSKK